MICKLINLVNRISNLLIMNSIQLVKQKFHNQFFNLPHVIDSLFTFMHKHHMISIKLDDIFKDEHNNNKFTKFTCWFNDLFIWKNHLMVIILIAKFRWLFIDPKLPSNLIVFWSMISIVNFFAGVWRMDILMAESNNNLRSFKAFYDLKHSEKVNGIRLSQSEYKKLSIIVGFIHLLFIKQSFPFGMMTLFITLTMICYLTKSITWILLSPFFMYTSYVICVGCFTAATVMYIILPYYRMLFNQINRKIKQISKSSLRKSLSQLPQLIHEHYKINKEIHDLNLAMNKTFGALFFTSAFGEMLALYLIIKVDQFYMILINGFILFCYAMCCLGTCTMLSMQVNSAHRSYNYIYLILINHKLGCRSKWKVNLILK